jgi:hypothetical protein
MEKYILLRPLGRPALKRRAVHLAVAYGVTAIENEVCRDKCEGQALYCIRERLV